VLAIVAFFVLGIRAGAPAETRLNLWTARAVLACVIWLALTGQIAHEGFLRKFDDMPPNIMILVLVSTVLTCVLAFSRLGLRLIDGAGPVWLVAFQVFRVPVCRGICARADDLCGAQLRYFFWIDGTGYGLARVAR
jgi:hypothetical protein